MNRSELFAKATEMFPESSFRLSLISWNYGRRMVMEPVAHEYEMSIHPPPTSPDKDKQFGGVRQHTAKSWDEIANWLTTVHFATRSHLDIDDDSMLVAEKAGTA